MSKNALQTPERKYKSDQSLSPGPHQNVNGVYSELGPIHHPSFMQIHSVVCLWNPADKPTDKQTENITFLAGNQMVFGQCGHVLRIF